MSGTSGRVVTLIDMDCFYCQVEARLNPVHQGKPLAVVQYNLWRGGGIIAVNYEARDQGVTRGMRGDQAKQMCPDIVLVSVASVRGKADLSKYRDAGKEVVDVFKEYCDCVERASIDEAYLDITQAVEQRVEKLRDSSSLITADQLHSTFIVGFCPDKSNAEDTRISGLTEFLEDQRFNPETLRLAAAAALVEELRAEVLKRTGFHCSAGIAHNKVLAKLVCGIHKPRRQTVLPASCVEQLFSALPVRKVRNLGGKFGVKVVEELGCETMGDLAKFTKEELQQRFDEKTGLWLYEIARGIDSDPVTPRLIPKSIGCSKNFPGKNSLRKKEDVEHWMKELCGEVADRLSQDLQENKRRAQLLTVTICLDGQSSSRSTPLLSYDAAKIAADALSLISRSNNAPANSSAWQPAITMIAASASKFVSDEGHRSSGIQSFFKQVPKSSKDETEKRFLADKIDTASKNSSNKINIRKECADALKEAHDSKPSPKPGNIGSFFKSQSQKIPAEVKSEENREEAEAEEKAPENSFFLNYLQKLKAPVRDSTPAKVESATPAKVESATPAKVESATVNSSTGNTVSENASKLDESVNLIREMFPDPSDVDESVIGLLSTSMQGKFYEWQTKFRRELGLASPEKVPRKTVPKAPAEVSPRKKPTEKPKPKGSIDTFFLKNGKPQQENSAQNPESQQPGCSYQYISEDSNSCDTFNLAENSYDEMEQCSICHEMILLREFPEHVDYHAALSLDEKLNKVEPVAKAPVQSSKSVVQSSKSVVQSSKSVVQSSKSSAVIPVKKRGRPLKSELIGPQNGKKLKSISSFFPVRGST